MVVRICLVFVALVLAFPAFAARAQLMVDTRTLEVGQRAQMHIIVVDGTSRSVPRVEVPDGFSARFSQQSTRTSSNLAGVTRITEYQFSLLALHEGVFELGPFQLEVDGTLMTTNTVSITVEPSPEEEGEQIAVEAFFDVAEAWEGQVVVYGYRLRTRTEIVGSARWEHDALDGLRPPREGDRPQREFVIEDESGPIRVIERHMPFLAVSTGPLRYR
ncbi:MAG: hypothetical protein HN348_31805, partial [Proteobacteria bacterium]|nr:hypothetical protein [Pseudomonadota bacterium]